MSSSPSDPELFSYWRSSCSYRVRIVLNLKGVRYSNTPVHLVRGGGEQLSAAHAARHPGALLPVLRIDGETLVQSPAICEYLEETRPSPALLPAAAAARARVRALCAAVACDTQPLANLRVLKHVAAAAEAAAPGAGDGARAAWARHWTAAGLDAVEGMLRGRAGDAAAGRYCEADAVSLADAFLLPQVYNAARFKLDVAARWPTIARIAAALEALPAFADAHPSRQPDAEPDAA
jgi:maleylacetoacetate isomerase